MYCHHCGTQVAAGVRFCPSCGQSVSAAGALTTSVPVPWTPRSGVEAQTGQWLGEGWRLVTADLGNYALITLVFILLNGVPFIQGALIAGFHVFTMKKLAGSRAEFSDFFTGFNFFIPTLVASLLIGLFTFAGALFCIIPGLVIAAMYKFTFLFIVDRRMDFWPAMQASHSVVRNDYFGFTMFLILLLLVNLLGLVCCVVGLLVSVPVTFAAITVAYQELVGFDPQTPERV